MDCRGDGIRPKTQMGSQVVIVPLKDLIGFLQVVHVIDGCEGGVSQGQLSGPKVHLTFTQDLPL